MLIPDLHDSLQLQTHGRQFVGITCKKKSKKDCNFTRRKWIPVQKRSRVP
jgi:hypothetical protein